MRCGGIIAGVNANCRPSPCEKSHLSPCPTVKCSSSGLSSSTWTARMSSQPHQQDRSLTWACSSLEDTLQKSPRCHLGAGVEISRGVGFQRIESSWFADYSTDCCWGEGLNSNVFFSSNTPALPQVGSHAVKGLLALVDRERRGEVVDRRLLQSLLRMLHSLGTYSDAFQRPFLDESDRFYRLEGGAKMTEVPVPEYLRHCEASILPLQTGWQKASMKNY